MSTARHPISYTEMTYKNECKCFSIVTSVFGGFAYVEVAIFRPNVTPKRWNSFEI
jgi:hypothetical protein